MKPTVCVDVCCRQQRIKRIWSTARFPCAHVSFCPPLKAAGRRTGKEGEVTEEYNDLRN